MRPDRMIELKIRNHTDGVYKFHTFRTFFGNFIHLSDTTALKSRHPTVWTHPDLFDLIAYKY